MLNTLKKRVNKIKMKKSSSITTFDEHLEKRYGIAGEEGRMVFEAKAKAFAGGELIKEERRLSKMTQVTTCHQNRD